VVIVAEQNGMGATAQGGLITILILILIAESLSLGLGNR
jgi:hypothetical protein